MPEPYELAGEGEKPLMTTREFRGDRLLGRDMVALTKDEHATLHWRERYGS